MQKIHKTSSFASKTGWNCLIALAGLVICFKFWNLNGKQSLSLSLVYITSLSSSLGSHQQSGSFLAGLRQGRGLWLWLLKRMQTDTQVVFHFHSGEKVTDWLNMTGLALSPHIWRGPTGGRGGCAGRWMAKTQRQSVCLCVEGGMICVLWFWSLHFCGWEGACVCAKGEDRKTTTENVFHEHFLWKTLIYCFKNIKVCTKMLCSERRIYARICLLCIHTSPVYCNLFVVWYLFYAFAHFVLYVQSMLPFFMFCYFQLLHYGPGGKKLHGIQHMYMGGPTVYIYLIRYDPLDVKNSLVFVDCEHFTSTFLATLFQSFQ